MNKGEGSVKPILFNSEMVRAILEGRKTVTRRVVKLKYSNTHLEMFTNKYGTRLIEKQNEVPGVTTVRNPDGTTTHKILACIEKEPTYRPGDILYVPERWKCSPDSQFWEEDEYRVSFQDGEAVRFYFESQERREKWNKYIDKPLNNWQSPYFMPREAARIFLRVTGVHVERLRDITYKDVGMDTLAGPFWDSTIKPADLAVYGWEANPWVWVISFEKISKEEAYKGA